MTSARNIYSYSDFPRPQNISSKLAIDMYRQYSRRGLSCKEDRPVAILGLEYRLAFSYMCVSLFGVLRKGSYKPSLSDTCLHETLVWKSDAEPLRKIKFRVSDQNQVVPSWSWMSRTGAIDYVSLPTNFRGTEINIDYDLVGDFDESSDAFQKKHCQLQVEFRKKLGASLNIDPSNDSWIRVIDNSELVGAVSFDECDGCNGRCHGNLLQAAVIGSARGLLAQCELEGVDPRASDREQYIVLLVEKDPRMKEHATEPSDKQPSGAAEKTYYNRIGLGIFETGWLESSTKELVYVL
jgi:hypothetical protein